MNALPKEAKDTEFLIDARNITVSYPKGDGHQVILNDINLHVKQGEFVTVVGSSGCGKSTLLSLILGSQKPTTGVVYVAGKQVELVNRDRGIVYQTYTLYNFLTVLQNIGLGKVLENTSVLGILAVLPLLLIEMVVGKLLRTGRALYERTLGKTAVAKILPAGRALFCRVLGKTAMAKPIFGKLGRFSPRRAFLLVPFFRIREEAMEQARSLLADIGLTPADGDKYPPELSGGMRQRVAIAQSVAMRPEILLMDEPFGALDSNRRKEMQDFIHDQWKKFGLTIFFVTHDLEEAVKLGTRLICLSQYWSGPSGEPAVGAKVVVDRKVMGGDVLPTAFARQPEFQDLVEHIDQIGLSKQILPMARFELTHPDALHKEEIL